MTNLTDFWKGRFAVHGHTGWADQRIYLFDQPCRLRRLCEYLETSGMKPGKALDFGCGSGDFSRLLIDRGWSVVAYDRYVSPGFSHRRLTPTQSLSQVAQNGPYDLVVSITVLDCIMDEAEFGDRLKDIRTSLGEHGRFFFLEYAVDNQKPASAYQRFRSFYEWQAEMAKAELSITDVSPYFHPEEATIPAWESFRKLFVVRALMRLARSPLPIPAACSAWFTRILANRCLASKPYVIPAKSPLKVMIGRATSERKCNGVNKTASGRAITPGAPQRFDNPNSTA